MAASDFDVYRVRPKSRVSLGKRDPADRAAFDGDKDDGLARLEALNAKLADLQELLYAGHRHRILIVLQAMDAGGKDGTIRSVFTGVNPQGVHVVSFRTPTPDERDRDFLWRVHRHVPGSGEIVIFNRSHYEDVLIVRVHDLVPRAVWSKRYEEINEFERTLAAEGTTILKFFLHIGKDEQRARLQERADNPKKRWKFSHGDVEQRKYWDDYMRAYEDALSKTSTDYAPWYIVPANRNWYRNLVVSEVLVDALTRLKMKYPKPDGDFSKIRIR
jgi:PPK2 family polyphosphate:nucleotide phosphotransferase